MARRGQANCSRRKFQDVREEDSLIENCENLSRPDPAYFSEEEDSPGFSQSRFAFSASIFGIAILIGFSITCVSDHWTSIKQFEIIKTNFQQLEKEIQTIKKMLQEITPPIENTEREMTGMMEMRNFLSSLYKSTNGLKEDIEKELSGKTILIMNALTDALKPLNEIIENGGFTADGTGKVDFALESTGGKVVNTPNTETYMLSTVQSFFGFPLCEVGNPQAIIQPGVLPGQCWAFRGSSGTAVIQLIGYVYITSVTMEHIPVVLSPTGSITSAPRIFSILGLKSEDDVDGFFFGQFSYERNGPPKQTFVVQHQSKIPYQYIELKVLSNHGEQRYTCVYRLRVHGELSSFTKPQNINQD